MFGRDGHKVCTHTLRTNTGTQYIVKGHVMVSVSHIHTHTLSLHLMTSRGASMTQHLSYLFFYTFILFFSSVHPCIHSFIKAFSE